MIIKNILDHIQNYTKSAGYKAIIAAASITAALSLPSCGEKTLSTLVIEPQIRFGAMDASEKNHQNATTHKNILGVGLDAIIGKEIKTKAGFQAGAMAEPTDEDRETIHDWWDISIELIRPVRLTKNTALSPYIGAGFQIWRRNSPDGSNQDQFYGDLSFAYVPFGASLDYKNLYFNVGGQLPVWSSTDSGHTPRGELGINLKGGIKLGEHLKIGTFYEKQGFDQDGSQTDFKFELIGIELGFPF